MMIIIIFIINRFKEDSSSMLKMNEAIEDIMDDNP